MPADPRKNESSTSRQRPILTTDKQVVNIQEIRVVRETDGGKRMLAISHVSFAIRQLKSTCHILPGILKSHDVHVASTGIPLVCSLAFTAKASERAFQRKCRIFGDVFIFQILVQRLFQLEEYLGVDHNAICVKSQGIDNHS